MRILVTPNAFKNSISANEAGEAIANGLKSSRLDASIDVIPIADGGDGTLAILSDHFDAELKQTPVNDPLGKEVMSSWAYSANGVAVIELAEASGIRLLNPKELNPWLSTSFGTGQLIDEAIKKGCTKIYLTVGGSATVDGGMGILQALGARFYKGNDLFVPRGPIDIPSITGLDLSRLRQKLSNTKITILTDVSNPLLGKNGSVQIYGRQKGIKESELDQFESIMQKWAEFLEIQTKKNVASTVSGGASGGVPAGLLAVHSDVEIVNGAEKILNLCGVPFLVSKADLVITCEGQIDMQTGFGKGPGAIAKLAADYKVGCIGFCGQVSTDYDPENSLFTAVFPINPKIGTLQQAMLATTKNLFYMSMQLGNMLALQTS